MSNGHACCVYGVCCPPNPDGSASPQAVAIAKKIANDLGWSAERTAEKIGLAAAAADWIVANFDVAPKGLTGVIVDLYGPLFAERIAEADAANLAGIDSPAGGAA